MSDSTPQDGTLFVARDTARARVLAFAIGTHLRRTGAVGRTALSVDDRALALVRDGLVQGLLLTGIDVCDMGVVDAEHIRGLAQTVSATLTVRVTSVDAASARIDVIIGNAPLSTTARARIDEILAKGDFASGEGVLTVTSARDARETPSPPVTTTAYAPVEPDPDESTGRVKRAGFLDEDTWVDG